MYFFIYFILKIRAVGYSGQHPVFPIGDNKVVLVISNRLTIFDWITKIQYNFNGQHVG